MSKRNLYEYSLEIDPEIRGFAYVLSGEVLVQGKAVKQTESCFIEKQNHIEIKARAGVRFGVPHNQAINQHGSFVD